MYARGIGSGKERPPEFFLGDEDQAGYLLFALFIPNNDLYNVSIEFSPGIFPGHLELIRRRKPFAYPRCRVSDLVRESQGLRFESDPGLVYEWQPRHALAMARAFLVPSAFCLGGRKNCDVVCVT